MAVAGIDVVLYRVGLTNRRWHAVVAIVHGHGRGSGNEVVESTRSRRTRLRSLVVVLCSIGVIVGIGHTGQAGIWATVGSRMDQIETKWQFSNE